ncbi:MAG: CHAT domain-containing tetratricopeptide repeat protein [Planctomycetota bacterium]
MSTFRGCLAVLTCALAVLGQDVTDLRTAWHALRNTADSPERLAKLLSLAEQFVAANAAAEAVPVLQQATQLARQLHGETDERCLHAHQRLGESLLHANALAAATEFEALIGICTRSGDELALARARSGLGLAKGRAGDDTAALEMFRSAHGALARLRPADDPEALRIQLHLACALNRLERYQEALPILRGLDRIWSRQASPPGPEHEQMLRHLAFACFRCGHLDEAAKHYRALMPTSAARLEHCTDAANLAQVLVSLGELEAADAVFAEALPRMPRDDSLGARDWVCAACSHSQSLLVRGRVKEAEAVLAEAEALAARWPLEDDQVRLGIYLLRARFLAWAGQVDEARNIVAAASATIGQKHPPGSPAWLSATWDIAAFEASDGDLTVAERMQREVLAAIESAPDFDRRQRAKAQCNLGGTLVSLRRYEDAEAILTTALQAMRNLYPFQDHNLQVARRELAVIARERGNERRFQELLQELLAAAALRQEGYDLDVGMMMMFAAADERLAGRSGAAIRLADAVTATAEKNLPADSSLLPLLRIGRAWLHSDVERAAAARAAAEKEYSTLMTLMASSEAVRELQQVAGMLMVLLRWEAGAFREALELQEQLLRLPWIQRSDRESRFLQATLRRELGEVAAAQADLAKLRTETPKDEGYLKALVDASYAYGLLSHGDARGAHAVMLETVAEARRFVLAEMGSSYSARMQANQRLWLLLSGLLSTSVGVGELASEDLANLLALRGVADHQARQNRTLTERLRTEPALRAKRDALVAAQARARRPSGEEGAPELASTNVVLTAAERAWHDAIGTTLDVREPGIADLAGHLPARGIAVVTCSYNRYVPQQEGAAMPPPIASVVAFVVARTGAVSRVELGPAVRLDAAAQRWRATLSTRIATGRSDPTPGRDPDAPGAAPELPQLLAPILASIRDDVDTLIVCPDGALATVPWEALPAAGGYLFERVRLLYVDSLAALQPESRAPHPARFVALGGVDYDAEPSAPAADPSLHPASPRGGWQGLPAAKVEVEALTASRRDVDRDAAITTLVGAEANRANLLAAVSGAKWLHIATHAFAGDLAQRDPSNRSQALGLLLPNHADDQARNCGLVLAGANARRNAGAFLTAAELSLLDLHGCELVVLSACDTNVGTRSFGDALAGLNRALHIAGARNTITSLWRVDDAGSAAFFTAFYRSLWEAAGPQGNRIADSLAAARQHVRQAGHGPGVWAAFVHYGSGGID